MAEYFPLIVDAANSTIDELPVGDNLNLANSGIVNAGNIAANNFIGNLANGNSNVSIPANGNVNISAVGNANIAVITGTGVNVAGTINSTGNITAPNFIGNVQGNISGNIVVPGSNGEVIFNNAGNAGASNAFTFNTSSNVLTIAGNVSATNFIGNGAALTALTGGNVTGQVGNALVAGTVYTAAQPNITSVGTLSSLAVTGNLSSGNANLGNATTANFFIGSGNNLSNIQGANVTGAVPSATTAGTVTTAAQPNITSVGTLTSLGVTGNASAGNLNTAGAVVASTLTSNVTTGTGSV
jgi:hypothetical protein